MLFCAADFFSDESPQATRAQVGTPLPLDRGLGSPPTYACDSSRMHVRGLSYGCAVVGIWSVCRATMQRD